MLSNLQSKEKTEQTKIFNFWHHKHRKRCNKSNSYFMMVIYYILAKSEAQHKEKDFATQFTQSYENWPYRFEVYRHLLYLLTFTTMITSFTIWTNLFCASHKKENINIHSYWNSNLFMVLSTCHDSDHQASWQYRVAE